MMSTAAMLALLALLMLALAVDVTVVINWLRRKR
jgi:hypothetical protein